MKALSYFDFYSALSRRKHGWFQWLSFTKRASLLAVRHKYGMGVTDMNTPESLRRVAAVHEAGHAVVAWALKRTVQSLSIGRDGGCVVKYDGPVSLIEEIAIRVAGAEATDQLRLPTWELANSKDDFAVAELLEDCSDGDEVHLRVEGLRLARKLLTEHMALLTKLANALELAGAMGTADVAELFKAARNSRAC
jgi:hypothetical protein